MCVGRKSEKWPLFFCSVTAGMCFVGVSLFFALISMAGPLIQVGSYDWTDTKLTIQYWDICVLVLYAIVPSYPWYSPWYYNTYSYGACFDFGDPFLKGTGEESAHNDSNITMGFLFTSIALAVIILVLGFLDCCRVIRLEKKLPYACLLFFSFLLLGFTIATAAIPTSEYDQEDEKFNNLHTRNSTFYYKAMKKIADSNVFDTPTSNHIRRDLVNPNFNVYSWWALVMIWLAGVTAFIAFVLFAIAKCCRREEPEVYYHDYNYDYNYDEKPRISIDDKEIPKTPESKRSSEERDEKSPTLRATGSVKSKSVVQSKGPQYGSMKDGE